MMNKNKIQKMIKPFLCGFCLILTGCSAASLAQESVFESAYENGEQEEMVNIYTSAASAVIKGVDEEDHTITVYLIERNENRTLSYDGATVVWDKYGSAMSMAQLRAGDVADLTYNSELERAGSVTLCADAWSYEGVAKYNLNAGNGSASIGDETYSINDKVLAFSEGRSIEADQIIHQDILTFHGRGHDIISITVDRGHGYLDLANEEAVLGGWIEIGQTVISQIAPDMLFTVPEGNYTVRFTSAGIDETREITIERNKETVLDLGDIKVPEPENGAVKFEVIPETAVVYVDDVKIDTTYPARLSLGLHQATAKASGYDTLSEYFRVDGEITTVKINLEESAGVSGNSTTPTVSEGSRITIEAPAGVDVYQDNLYKGIAPVTYTKTAGEHTITLRRTGYITRSYSIFISDDSQDVTYSFPELEPDNTSRDTLGDDTVSGNTLIRETVSGNTVSGNTISGNMISGNSVR